ncbi:hypothetical protein WOLCODRAFT_20781 [Wolfiporia cocos MD-104 SS10]|uniref:Uncharacterized protein n=1 Tax=Wolfiporia cocos (strain MD-104) TaxID=742152 RepID=A0A2H3J5B7_WOLCO|nr:hypothetical protein WOLCODRAFT_20781 [Wolfiporia cocos MD-104 SS10]
MNAQSLPAQRPHRISRPSAKVTDISNAASQELTSHKQAAAQAQVSAEVIGSAVLVTSKRSADTASQTNDPDKQSESDTPSIELVEPRKKRIRHIMESDGEGDTSEGSDGAVDSSLVGIEAQVISDNSRLTIGERRCDIDQFFDPPYVVKVEGRLKKHRMCKLCRLLSHSVLLAEIVNQSSMKQLQCVNTCSLSIPGLITSGQ